jgi:hypothetical protein
MEFIKATKKRSKLRLAIDGPSGSGKTYTALTAAKTLGGKIAVIDTERGSASLYSDKFNFDVLELHTFSPALYIDAIETAEKAGYDVIVIDSLSHAWEGEGGALDMVDQAAKRSQSNNTYTAWKDVTPLQRKLVDAMLQSPCHIIATMRSKTEYILETNDKGRQVPKKVGMAPIQRQGMEYEFTLVCDMDLDHNCIVSKSRCEALADKVVGKPDHKFFDILVNWLNSGEEQKPVVNPKQVEEKPVEAQLPAFDAPIVHQGPPTITLEQALAVTDSKGTRYGDCTSEDLAEKTVWINKALKNGKADAKHQDELLYKLNAVRMILTARSMATPGTADAG